MKIAQAFLDGMVEHALATAPQECCGIVACRANNVVRVYPTTNTAPDPLHNYEVGQAEQYKVQTEISSRRWQMGAVYHSHPFDPPYPSYTDKARAFYPDILYIIIGLLEQPEVRAFRIHGGLVSEADLRVIG